MTKGRDDPRDDRDGGRSGEVFCRSPAQVCPPYEGPRGDGMFRTTSTTSSLSH